MTKAKVLVSDKLSDSGLEVLRNAQAIQVDYRPGLSHDELADAISDYDALIIRSGSKVTAQVLERAGRLRVIGEFGQPPNQILPPTKIETSRRLVQQQQLRVGHESPGDLDPLAFALGEGAVRPSGQRQGT